jgi:hypothetical protein
MDRYYEDTQPHPFDRRSRINSKGTVVTDIFPHRTSISLSAIQSLYPGERRGDASDMVRYFLDLSDEFGVELHGTAKAYGMHEDFLTTEQLREWYARLGLTVSDNNSVVYHPGDRDR